MRFAFRTAILASALSVFACGGDDSDGPSAPDQCVALFETTCHRVRLCGEELSDETAPANFEKDCVAEIQVDTPCAKATAVSSKYTACIDALNAVKCDEFLGVDAQGEVAVALPASCNATITFVP
jgi:hypothetical protein